MREQDLDKRGKTTEKKRRVRKAKIRPCTPLFFAIRSPNFDRAGSGQHESSRIESIRALPLLWLGGVRFARQMGETAINQPDHRPRDQNMEPQEEAKLQRQRQEERTGT